MWRDIGEFSAAKRVLTWKSKSLSLLFQVKIWCNQSLSWNFVFLCNVLTVNVTSFTVKVFPFSLSGYLFVHHQTTKGAGRHQEPSVQQILLPAGGKVLIQWKISVAKHVLFCELGSRDSPASCCWRNVSLYVSLEPGMGKVIQHMLWTGGLQWDFHPAFQNPVLCHQVRLLLNCCCVLLCKILYYHPAFFYILWIIRIHEAQFVPEQSHWNL